MKEDGKKLLSFASYRSIIETADGDVNWHEEENKIKLSSERKLIIMLTMVNNLQQEVRKLYL